MGVWRRVARAILLLIQVLAGVVVMMALYIALIFGLAIMATGSWPPLAFSAGEQAAALAIVGLAVAIVGAKMAAGVARRKEKQREAEAAAETNRQAEEQRKNERARQEEEGKRKRAEAEAEAKRRAEDIHFKEKIKRSAKLARESITEGRKRRLTREWLEVMKQWRVQDQKGQPRNPAVMAMIEIQRERAQNELNPDVRAWLMGNIQRLQELNNSQTKRAQQLDLGAGNRHTITSRQNEGANAGAFMQATQLNAGEQATKRAEPVSAEKCIRELAEIVRTAFLVRSCPRCHENKMALIEVSPNAKSIEYACVHCGRRQRAAATSPDAARAKTLEKFIVAVLGKTWFKTLRHGYRCTFLTPEATLPYERPTRELIPEAMRAQVWRRDDGRCVQCGSRENLHIDHIVPVSRGGATSVSNLQVLCQSCNLSKGAKI